MIEPVLVSVSVAALGAWGIRVLRQLDSLHGKADDHGERLARVEGQMSNGIQAELTRLRLVDDDVRSLKRNIEEFAGRVEEHINLEEQRIVDIYRKLVEEGEVR